MNNSQPTSSKQTLRTALNAFIEQYINNNFKIWSEVAIVKSIDIDNTYCDVQTTGEEGDEGNVRCFLQANTSMGFWQVPKLESSVIITWLSKTNAVITGFSEVDFIYGGFMNEEDEHKKTFMWDIENKNIEMYREDDKIFNLGADFANKKFSLFTEDENKYGLGANFDENTIKVFVEDKDKMLLNISKDDGVKVMEDGQKAVVDITKDGVEILKDTSKTAMVVKADSVEILKGSQTIIKIESNGNVTFNGGMDKGLVKVQSMVDWMMKVYQDMQMIKTTFSTGALTGTILAPAGMAGGPCTGTLGVMSFSPQTPTPVAASFENPKIKQ